MPHSKLVIHDHTAESNLYMRRAFLAFLFVVMMMLILLSNLYYLQVVKHDTYTTRSDDNRINVKPIAPNRGLIFDRNGKLLAENRPAFSVEIVPEKVDDIKALLKQVAQVIELTEEQQAAFVAKVKRQRRFKSVVLKNNLSEDEVARISVQQHKFPGLSIAARLTRFYPYGEALTHALGYVGKINKIELQAIDEQGKGANYAASYDIGKQGLEKFYEEQLHGTVGYRKVEVNSAGRVLRTLETTPPTPGNDLILTLDIDLQKAAQRALKGTRGAVVAIDAKDGGILAFYSNPSYDPNLFVHGISSEDYKPLINSKDRPLINRVTQGQYPPASTAKPFLALLGLDLELVTEHSKIHDPGFYRLPRVKRKYRDWTPYGHGKVDVYTSIEQSCDIYYYDLAYRLGIDKISDFMARFGFGEKTGVDIFEEANAILPSTPWKRALYNEPFYAGDTISVGIGQGYWTTTLLQLATATTTLVNRGKIKPPHFTLSQKVYENGKTTSITTPDPDRPPIQLQHPKNWQIVLDAMHGTVIRGTAKETFKGTTYDSAGKTGTAQRVSIAADVEYDASKLSKRNLPNAMYTGFAPFDDPQIVIAVVVENGESGSGVGAPVAKVVLDQYFSEKKAGLSLVTHQTTEPN